MNDYNKEKINLVDIITRGSFTGNDINDEVGHAVHHKVWRSVLVGTYGIIFESGVQRGVRNEVEAYEY